MTEHTQQAQHCFSCSRGLDPDAPHWTTQADYYLMSTGAKKVADLECQWSEIIASYCPNCIAAFHLDHFVFDSSVPKSEPRKLLCECSYCDYVIEEEGEYLFVLHVVEYTYADQAQHLLAHSVTHVVICQNCDGAIDPLSAVLQKKHGTNPIEQLPEPGI